MRGLEVKDRFGSFVSNWFGTDVTVFHLIFVVFLILFLESILFYFFNFYWFLVPAGRDGCNPSSVPLKALIIVSNFLFLFFFFCFVCCCCYWIFVLTFDRFTVGGVQVVWNYHSLLLRFNVMEIVIFHRLCYRFTVEIFNGYSSNLHQ